MTETRVMHHEDREELVLQTLLGGSTLEEAKANEKTLAFISAS